MGRAKKYPVDLSAYEREELNQFVACGRKSAREINRARILLLADRNESDRVVGETLGVTRRTVHRMRQHFAERDSEPVLSLLVDQPRRGRPLEIDARVQAKAAMVACSEPPAGTAKWTLRLIADRLVALDVVESISHEGVRTALKKTA